MKIEFTPNEWQQLKQLCLWGAEQSSHYRLDEQTDAIFKLLVRKVSAANKALLKDTKI